MPPSDEIPDAKAAVNFVWEKLEKIPAWQMDLVKSKKDVILEAQKKRKGKSTLLYWWTCVISRKPSWNENTKNTKDESRSEETQLKMTQVHARYPQNKDRQLRK